MATSNLLKCKSIWKLALKTIIGWRNKGKGIAVLHNGQALKRAGAGKLCELEGTIRAKMNNHMQSRRSKIGYVSMKIKYIEKQASRKKNRTLIDGGKWRSSKVEIELEKIKA